MNPNIPPQPDQNPPPPQPLPPFGPPPGLPDQHVPPPRPVPPPQGFQAPPPSGSGGKPAKAVFFILTGLTGLVALAIAGLFVAGLFSGVDGALEKIGMECSPTTEEDWEDAEDPEAAAVIKRGHDCEFDNNAYHRISADDYDFILDYSLQEIVDSEESVERQLEECEDENSRSSRVNAYNLIVGGYVFSAGGSPQIEELAEALKAEGVDSEPAETSCERLAKSRE